MSVCFWNKWCWWKMWAFASEVSSADAKCEDLSYETDDIVYKK